MENSPNLKNIVKHFLKLSHPKAKVFQGMLLALLKTRRCQYRDLAVGLECPATTESKIRTIERFMEETDIPMDCFVDMMVNLITETDQRFVLIVDRTNWKVGEKDMNILTIVALLPDDTAIPLAYMSLDHQGNSNTAQRIALFDMLLSKINPSQIDGVLGDREFIGDMWFHYFYEKDIPFYFRVKHDMQVPYSSKETKPMSHFFETETSFRFLEKEIEGKILYFEGKNLGDELLIIASNRGQRGKISQMYKKRWFIEVLFKNTKTGGFNLESTCIKKSKRLIILLMIMAVGVFLCYKEGLLEEKRKATPVRKTIGYRLYSVFKRGLYSLMDLAYKPHEKLVEKVTNLLKNIHEKIFFDRGIKSVG